MITTKSKAVRRKTVLTTVTFLLATTIINSSNSAEITTRQDIRKSPVALSFDNNTYTNSYSSLNEPLGAAIFVHESTISSIDNSIFINNNLTSSSTTIAPHGGAVTILDSNVSDIKNSKFINNVISSNLSTYDGTAAGGGALSLGAEKTTNIGTRIKNIDTVLFEKNKVIGGSNPIGGALIINNLSSIANLVNSTFDGNSVYTNASAVSSSSAQGGAISILGELVNIKNSIFKNNTSESVYSYSVAGALNYQALLGNLKLIESSDFINNSSISGSSFSFGGAIASMKSIDIIKDSNFKQNSTKAFSVSSGGAIYSAGTINSISNTNFSQNKALSTTQNAYGGAIACSESIKEITNSAFNANIAQGYSTTYGGAIYNTGARANIVLLDNTHFEKNSAISTDGTAAGGAIFNTASIGKIRNSDFIGNKVEGKTNAMGGAIYSNKNLLLEADNYTSKFSENTIKIGNDEVNNNAIHISNSELTLKTINHGAFLFDDSLSGTNYNLVLTGDGTGNLVFNNKIAGATNISAKDTTINLAKGIYGQGVISSIPNLTLDNSTLNIANNYLETVEVKNYTAQNNSFLHIDVSPDKMLADKMIINGDVKGVTKLIVYADSNTDIRNKGSIVFAESSNDTTGTARSFEIFRVYTSPYLYDIVYNENNTDKEWKWQMSDIDNPYKKQSYPIIVAPEIMAYHAVIPAAIEQTRSMVSNVRNKVAANKLYSTNCRGLCDEAYNGIPLHNAWVNPIYFNSNINDEVEMESNIYGLEAGFDIQHNLNHKLGIFASYRQGDYDINGDGKKYFSPIESQLDIDSYIGGLYYRYDYNSWWTFATIYGGSQKVEIKTDDGIMADTNGTQIGGGLELGKLFSLDNKLTLEPSLGMFYTQIDFDDTQDRFGKTARYDTISQTEIEAGIKLEKIFNTNQGILKLYVKPSIVQPITTGDSVYISNLGKVKSYEDNILGRGEMGVRMVLTQSLSGYSYFNYTAGSKYQATAAGIGLNYNW